MQTWTKLNTAAVFSSTSNTDRKAYRFQINDVMYSVQIIAKKRVKTLKKEFLTQKKESVFLEFSVNFQWFLRQIFGWSHKILLEASTEKHHTSCHTAENSKIANHTQKPKFYGLFKGLLKDCLQRLFFHLKWGEFKFLYNEFFIYLGGNLRIIFLRISLGSPT